MRFPLPAPPRWSLPVCIALAVLLRAAIVGWHPPTADEVLTPLNDSTDYHVLACGLVDGKGWVGETGAPSAFRPPVYPLFLAAVYTVFGKGSLWAVAAIQVLLSAAATWFCARIARGAGGSEWGAVLAALGYAVYPAFLTQAGQILTEELGRVLLLGGAMLLLEARNRTVWLAASGAVLALAVLNKSVLAAAMPFLSFLAAGNPLEGRAWVRRGATFAIPALLLIGCWTARNYALSGRFIPVSTNFPITWSQGVTRFSLYTNEWYGTDVELLTAPDDFLALTQLRNYSGIEEELAVGAQWSDKARAWVDENPGVYGMLTMRKALHYWGPFVRNSPAVQAVAVATMGPVLLFGWIAIMGSLRAGGNRRRAALMTLAIALPTTIPYAISQPDVRYRLALAEPFWLTFAALWLGSLLCDNSRNSSTATAPNIDSA